MTRLVIDASVAVKWVVGDAPKEEGVDEARLILEALQAGTVEVRQPVHWLVEVAGVLARIRPEVAPRAVALLQAMALPVADGPEVLTRACALGVRLGHHVFDTLYHAVALEDGRATLITADDAYYRKARGEGAILRLADWRTAEAR